jgi:cytochrome b pre-mRNA-processing protein 3
MLNLLRKSAARKEFAARLETQLVARARDPYFFRTLIVPDTVDGRFDLVTLHGWLVLERLKGAGMDAAAQALTDILFIGFDEALREQGIGDMGMGRRMKAFANAFFGRLSAYGGARDEGALGEALAKNVWRGAPVDARARALAAYVASARIALTRGDLAGGVLDFGSLPILKDPA